MPKKPPKKSNKEKPKVEYRSQPIEMNDQKYRTFVHLLAVNWDAIKPKDEDENEMTWNRSEFKFIVGAASGCRYNGPIADSVWSRISNQHWHYLLEDVKKVRGSKNMLEALNDVVAPVNHYYYSMYADFCQNLIHLCNEDGSIPRQQKRMLQTYYDNFDVNTIKVPKEVLELCLPDQRYSQQERTDFNTSLRGFRSPIAKMKFAHYLWDRPHVMPKYKPPGKDIVMPKDLEDYETEDELSEEEKDITQNYPRIIVFLGTELVDGLFSVFESCTNYSRIHAGTVRRLIEYTQNVALDVMVGGADKYRRSSSPIIGYNEPFNASTAAASSATPTSSDVNIGAATSNESTSAANRRKPTVKSIKISPGNTFVPTTRGKYGQSTRRKVPSRSVHCNAEQSLNVSSTDNDENVEKPIVVRPKPRAPVASTAELVGWEGEYSRNGEKKWQPVQDVSAGESSSWGEGYPKETAEERLETQAEIAEELPTGSERHLEEVPRVQHTAAVEQPHMPGEFYDELVKALGVPANKEPPTSTEQPVEEKVGRHEGQSIEILTEERPPKAVDLLSRRGQQLEKIARDQQVGPAEKLAFGEPSHESAVSEQQTSPTNESQNRLIPSPRKLAKRRPLQDIVIDEEFRFCEGQYKVAGIEQRMVTGGESPTWEESLPRKQAMVRQQPQVMTDADLLTCKLRLYEKMDNVSTSELSSYGGRRLEDTEKERSVPNAEISPTFLKSYPRKATGVQEQSSPAIIGQYPIWSEGYPMNVTRDQQIISHLPNYQGLNYQNVSGDQRAASNVLSTLLKSDSSNVTEAQKEPSREISEQLSTWSEGVPLSHYQRPTETQQQDPPVIAGQLSTWRECYPTNISREQLPVIPVSYSQGPYYQDVGGYQHAATTEILPRFLKSTQRMPVEMQQQYPSAIAGQLPNWGEHYPINISEMQQPVQQFPSYHNPNDAEERRDQAALTLLELTSSKTAGAHHHPQYATSEDLSSWGVQSYEDIRREQYLLPIREVSTAAGAEQQTLQGNILPTLLKPKPRKVVQQQPSTSNE